MNRLFQAFRAFWKVLGDAQFAEHAAAWSPRGALPAPRAAAVPAVVREPARHDGLSVLAALQREARLVDFLKEPVQAYSDAQIGAAVRDIHRDAGAALERMFALRPLMEKAEGETVQVEAGYDPARVRLAGNVAGEPPHRGKLCHHGWIATRCDVPEWTGRGDAAQVVAPAEIHLD